MDVLRYYFPVLCQLIGMGGIIVGGPWVWAGVAQLPLFALVDPMLGDDLRERKTPTSDAIMDIPVVLCALLGPVTLMVLAWKVGQGGLGTVELLGIIASGAWLKRLQRSRGVGAPAGRVECSMIRRGFIARRQR